MLVMKCDLSDMSWTYEYGQCSDTMANECLLQFNVASSSILYFI